MIILGLTGSIGMGKSTAAAMLGKMSCAVHDSDKTVYDALQPTGKAFEEVAITFPKAWDKKKRLLKKDVLAQIIFADTKKRRELENILHPIVQRAQKDFIKTQKRLGRKFVVLDIPLLFETGADQRVHYTLVVDAPHSVQRRRVLARSNMDEKKFQAILKTQMSNKVKCRMADFVIPTGRGLATTWGALHNCLQEIKEREYS